MTRKTEL